MFRIRLPSGEESEYESADDFTLAVQRGAVTPDSAIFHAKAERWVPVSSHPTYHRAVSATRPAVRPIQTQKSAAPQSPAAAVTAPRAAVPASAPAVTAPRPAVQVNRPAPQPPKPPASELELLLPDPMLGSGTTAQRAVPAPAPQVAPAPVPQAAPAPRAPYVARVAPAAPASPAATAAAAAQPAAPGRPDDLVFVDSATTATTHPVAPAAPRHSAPRPAIEIAPPPVVEMTAQPLVEEPEPVAQADAPAGFVAHGDLQAFDPVVTSEVAAPSAHEPKPARVSHPAPAVEPPRHEPHPAPVVHAAAEHGSEQWHAGDLTQAARKPKGNSPRLLLIAAVVALMVAGVGLVAWRSGAARGAEAQAGPTTVPQSNPQVQAPAPVAPSTGPAASLPAAAAPAPVPVGKQPSPLTTPPPAPAQAPAPAVAVTPDTASAILPGRPQTMSMDLDVSGATVGQETEGPAANSGISLATATQHYSDAIDAAANQLDAQMKQIGFSKVLSPVRFSSVEGMEGARHTISSAAGMLASYRSRMQAIEKAYSDSAAQAQRNQKTSPRDILGWEHRLPNRETPEAAQVVDLSLTQVDNFFAALLQHPGAVQVSGDKVTITDTELDQQYKVLKQWLGQKLDVWSDAPAAAVPPTVEQVVNAFVKGAAR
jgi:hypothetical protein